MAVHNAVLKRAEKLGFIIEDLGAEEGDSRYKLAVLPFKETIFGADAKSLVTEGVAIKDMRENYTSFELTVEEDNTITIRVRGTDIVVQGMRAIPAFAKAKELWMESRSEMDIEDEEADDEVQEEIDAEVEEEDDRPGSVVSATYRARYAELGHPTTCGDWLARVLDGICKNKEGTSLDLFELICEANGVSLAKYNRTTNGWQGRLRMTGRNLLGKVVFHNGEMKMPDTIGGGEPIPVPAEWRTGTKYKAAPAPVTAVKTTPVLEPQPEPAAEQTTEAA